MMFILPDVDLTELYFHGTRGISKRRFALFSVIQIFQIEGTRFQHFSRGVVASVSTLGGILDRRAGNVFRNTINTFVFRIHRKRFNGDPVIGIRKLGYLNAAVVPLYETPSSAAISASFMPKSTNVQCLTSPAVKSG